jgi:hypothetical protein
MSIETIPGEPYPIDLSATLDTPAPCVSNRISLNYRPPCWSHVINLSTDIVIPAPCAQYVWGTAGEQPPQEYMIIPAQGTLTWTGYITEVVSYAPVFINSEQSLLEIICPTHTISGGLKQDLPITLGPAQYKIPWSTADRTERHCKFPWESADVVDNHVKIPWGTAARTEVSKSLPWNNVQPYKDNHVKIPWAVIEEHVDDSVQLPWTNILPYKDVHEKLPWVVLNKLLDKSVDFPFTADTPLKDKHMKIPWGAMDKVEKTVDLHYEVMDSVDTFKKFHWEPYPYSLLNNTYYYAPPPCFYYNFTGRPLPGYNPCGGADIFMGWHENIVNPFDHNYTGIRDKYLIVPEAPPGLIYRKFYYMQNTVLLKRLPDNTPLDALAISISTDISSWTWDFNITLADSAYLDLIKPEVAGEDLVLKDVQITINNNVFICRVESWNETRVFGERAWSVRGRSPSIELGSPYSLPFTYTNTSSKQGNELINDLLSGTGWSVEWGFDDDTSTYSPVLNPATDWLVPANQFNLQEKTTMEGIMEVLRAIQASIITKPDCSTGNQSLIIIPRYRWTPWQWGSQTLDDELIRNYCREIGSDYEHIPKYNFVIAAGDNQGVVVSATKDSTAGDKPAPMFTHPLITTQQAGHEATRNLLSRSGMWINNSLSLLSIDDGVTPTEEIPGLLLPGKLISLEDDSVTWRGVVTGVTINVKATTSRSGLEVEQLVNVERYYG